MKSFPSLTAVCHQVVLNAPNGLDADTISNVLGKNYQTLMSELSRQQGHKFGADFILPLCSATDSVLPVQVMCREVGGVFVPVHKGRHAPAALVEQLARTVKEFGDFAIETAEGIADGKVEADEIRRIKAEGHEAVEAIYAMMRLAQDAHERQYGKSE